MKRRTKHQEEREKKRRERKKRSQLEPGGRSRYARKRAYLLVDDRWGFQVPEPKPWK